MMGGQAFGRTSRTRIRHRALAARVSSLHVILLQQTECHRSRQARHDRDVDDADCNDGFQQAGRCHGEDQQAEHHGRDGDEQIHRAHDGLFHHAAVEGRDQTERHADRKADPGGTKPDGQ
jgi:hypothetical protein